MSIEEKVKNVFKDALDVQPDEIKNDQPLDVSLGIDSTEMVEIVVSLKKTFNVDIQSTEMKKTNTFDQLVETLKSKGVA